MSLFLALNIVERGGSFDIGLLSFGVALEQMSIAVLALTAGKVLHIALAAYHSAPSLTSSRTGACARWCAVLSWRTMVKVSYHAGWAAALFNVYFNTPGLGSATWWALVAARLVLFLLGNGIAHGLVRWTGSILVLRAEYVS